ncbi:hypothetical protein THAOC_04606, partial [Thalassiosira oceanica]
LLVHIFGRGRPRASCSSARPGWRAGGLFVWQLPLSYEVLDGCKVLTSPRTSVLPPSPLSFDACVVTGKSLTTKSAIPHLNQDALTALDSQFLPAVGKCQKALQPCQRQSKCALKGVMTRKVKCKDGAAVAIGVAQGTMSIDDEDVKDDEGDKEAHPIIFNTSFWARRAWGEFRDSHGDVHAPQS